ASGPDGRRVVASICAQSGDCECTTLEEVATPGGRPLIRVRKPVIYFYPEKPLQVRAWLELRDARLSAAAYPKMVDNAWEVEADRDGTLTDPRTGRRFSYLFWEAQQTQPFGLDERKAFCVPGRDAGPFLEEVLPALGLNFREANDFITYWLP